MYKFEKSIAKKSSSTLFIIKKLPKKYRDDVFKLYSFFHLAKGCSDPNNLDPEKFKYIVRRWQAIKRDNLFGHYEKVDNSEAELALANLCYLVNRYDLSPKDVDDYLRSIAIELRNKSFHNSQEMARYLQFSAEAPAAMLAKVMQLPNALTHNAKMRGRAVKITQLLLSMAEDAERGRCYIPNSELKSFGLPSLTSEDVMKNQSGYKKLIELQIKRYNAWQDEATRGDAYLPKRLKNVIGGHEIWHGRIMRRIEKEPTLLYANQKLNAKMPSSVKIYFYKIARR